MSQEDTTQDDKKKLPELAKEKAARVRQHLKDNKTTYILCGATGVVCFVAGKYLRRPIVIDFQPIVEINNLPTFNNHNIGNSVDNVVKFGGRVSKIVRDIETGEEWQKMRYLAEEAAKQHGISYDSARVRLKDHLQGRTDNFFGKTYSYVGIRSDL